MTKTALFGGSFDPIHFGHINLAIEMLEKHGLDKVLFCPVYQNPLKDQKPTEEHHRLEMLRIAIADIPQFEILEWELQQKGLSYTVATLEHLSHQYKNLYLIMGSDSQASFTQWKDWEKIERLATVLAAPRDPEAPNGGRFRVLEVSSTELRERIRKGLYCEHLMPKNVLDYIRSHQLYLSPDYAD